MKHLASLLISSLSLAPTSVAQVHAPELDVPWQGYDVFHYPQGLDPRASALADLNGDGVPDLAVVSWPANPQLSVLFADGVGGFLPPVLYDRALGSEGIEAVDIDGDGDVDLLVTDSGQGAGGDTVSIYHNDGAGGLTVVATVPVGGGPKGLSVADVDGEGNLDVAVARSGAVGLALSDGAGGYLPPLELLVDYGSRDIAAGDLDGDGDVDLVVAHETKKISVLRNNGLGFDAPEVHPSLPGGSFNTTANVHLADVDLDGDLDALYSSTSTGDGPGGIGFGAVALFRNPGDGSFGPAETVPLDVAGGGAQDVAVADVTGDGWPDLVAPTGSSGIWCLVPGDGAGGFATAASYRAGDTPFLAEVGDFDGNGELDVAIVASGSLELCVYRNRGGGAFVDPPFVELVEASKAPVSSSDLNATDVDGDGDLDALVGYSANFLGEVGLSVRRNEGDGTFAAAELYPAPRFPRHLTTGDLNGDDRPDAVWLESGFSPRVRYRVNSGDGTFGAIAVAPGTYCGDEAEVALLDADGDGRLDLIVADCLAQVFTTLNTGHGFGPRMSHGLSSSADAVAGGDFDNDGDLDLATNSGIQGYVEVSLGLGNGTYQAPFTETSGRGVNDIAVGDLDGDGELDLAAAYSLDGDGVSVLLGQSDGTFEPPKNYHGTYSGETDDVAIADVDGDGLLDLLTANESSQDISYWRNRGGAELDELRRYGAGRPATSLVPGDWTGDGRLDVAVLVEPDGAGLWYYPALTVLRGRPPIWADLGQGLAGLHGVPVLTGEGTAEPMTANRARLEGALESSVALHVAGTSPLGLPILGGVVVPTPDVVVVAATDGSGSAIVPFSWPAPHSSGFELFFQSWIADPAAPFGFSSSNGLRARQP